MPRKTDPFLDSFGTLEARRPSPLERIAEFLSKSAYGNDNREGMQRMMGLLGQSSDRSPEGSFRDALNPIGGVLSAYDSGQDIGSGRYMAGFGLGAAALPLPGDNVMKSIAKEIAGREKSFASKSARLYNPKPLPQREFTADYQHGAIGDETGRLKFDMENRPLTARYVAGRTHVGAGDSGIPAQAYDALAEATTGGLPQTVAKSKIDRDAGRYVVEQDRRSGKVISRGVFIDKALQPESANLVLAHELAHAVDEIVGMVPVAGLDDELRGVYNHQNNPQNHGRRFGPEQHGYAGEKANRELMAEAIRAYKFDPNYFKTVAPKTAAAIRAAVNAHPELSKIIQFNNLAPAAIGLGVVAGQNDQDVE